MKNTFVWPNHLIFTVFHPPKFDFALPPAAMINRPGSSSSKTRPRWDKAFTSPCWISALRLKRRLHWSTTHRRWSHHSRKGRLDLNYDNNDVIGNSYWEWHSFNFVTKRDLILKRRRFFLMASSDWKSIDWRPSWNSLTGVILPKESFASLHQLKVLWSLNEKSTEWTAHFGRFTFWQSMTGNWSTCDSIDFVPMCQTYYDGTTCVVSGHAALWIHSLDHCCIIWTVTFLWSINSAA